MNYKFTLQRAQTQGGKDNQDHFCNQSTTRFSYLLVYNKAPPKFRGLQWQFIIISSGSVWWPDLYEFSVGVSNAVIGVGWWMAGTGVVWRLGWARHPRRFLSSHVWCLSWDDWNSWGLPPTWLLHVASLDSLSMPSQVIQTSYMATHFHQRKHSKRSEQKLQGFFWLSFKSHTLFLLENSIGCTGPAQVQ